MFRKYEPSGARTAAMFAATTRNQSAYLSGGTGVKPLEGSYSLWVAYGGEVITRFAFTPSKRRATAPESRQSAQMRRCPAIFQISLARVTGSAGASGMSFS